MHVYDWVFTPSKDLYDENIELVLKMWLMLYIHAGDKPGMKEFLKKERVCCKVNSENRMKPPDYYYLVNGCSIMGDVFLVRNRDILESMDNVELGIFDVRVPPEDIIIGG